MAGVIFTHAPYHRKLSDANVIAGGTLVNTRLDRRETKNNLRTRKARRLFTFCFEGLVLSDGAREGRASRLIVTV